MGATAVRERISDGVRLAGRALKLSRPSTDLLALPAGALQATRTLAHMVFPIGTSTALNCSLTSDRRLVTARRPFADLLTIKRHHRATVNDVVLAICAGALHRLLKDSGEESRRLKAMVPVSARDPHQRAELGNQVSALFLGLPSDETDPVERLRQIQRSMGARKRARDDQAARVAAEALRYVPRSLRRLAAPQLVAKAQGFNLTISNIPGPRQPLYMLGCRLDEAYPVVPLPENHALSIGMTAIDQTACFGTYVDPVALPEADRFADCLHTALDELLDTTNHRSRPSASARSSRPHPVRAD
jgi:diacylglycerol O-acyltransferase